MGKERVGLLAGRVRVTSDDKGDFYIPKHLCKLRWFYIMLGIGLILCNVAMVGPGLHSVEDATLSIRKLTRSVDDLATQGLLIMDGVSSAERNIHDLDIESLLNLQDACPNLEGNEFTNNKQLKSSIASLDTAFNKLREFVDGNEFEYIRENIDMVMDGTSNVDEFVTSVEVNDWIVKMSVLILNALVGFMIITTLVSLSGTYLEPLKMITMILVFPAFIVLVCSSWIGAAFVSFIGVSNADFCSGPDQNGPDESINNILQSYVRVDSIVFQAFAYFQSDCATEDPIQDFYKYEEYIQTGISSAQSFLAHIDEIGTEEISERCGASVRPIVEGIGLVKDNLGILLSGKAIALLISLRLAADLAKPFFTALRSTFDLASCSRMRPIYKQAVEGTACIDSAGSLILMFSLLLGVGVLGMLMMMFRAAMYPCKLAFSSEACQLPDQDEDEWEEYQAYLRYMTDFLSYWGRQEEETPSIHKDDNGTKSSSSSEEDKNLQEGIPEMVTCEASSSWESRSFPPDCNPDYESSCLNPNELQPLSPKTPSAPDFPSQNTPFTEPLDTIHDECQPLSPDTPTMRSVSSRSIRDRIRTPDFLSPGTFRRWRRSDIEELSTSSDYNDIPKTPLMISPKEHGGSSYFSKALPSFKSPLTKRVQSPDGSVENPAKNKYF
eukprot:scaffold8377_cov75-Cyclotella_meneghiniana.AAC.2